MEVIQNNVAQNLMAMFPMRPAELILQCVTHPRNCYEPVDEGILLNRCIDDLLSRDDASGDDAPSDDVKVDIALEPVQNKIVDDFVVDDFIVDDIPDGDPVVVDEPEVVFETVQNLQDLDVEPDSSKKKEMVIDLTDDTPTKEVKTDVIVDTEISSTLNSASLKDGSNSLSKKAIIDETDGELPDVLGFLDQPFTTQQSKLKSHREVAHAAAATSSSNSTPSRSQGGAANSYNPTSLNHAHSVAPNSGNWNFKHTTALGNSGFQSKVNSQGDALHRHAASTTCSTGMSATSGVSTGETTDSRPAVATGYIQSGFQFKSNLVSAVSSASFGGICNAQSRPVVINGHVGLNPSNNQKVPKLRIHVGQNGNYVVGSSTQRALTSRQELERKKAIPATLSRAPSDEMKPDTPVMQSASVPGGYPVSNLAISENEIKAVRPKFQVNIAPKDGSDIVSSSVTLGNTGIPLKISTPSGMKAYSKPATLSRAPSVSSANTIRSFQPASELLSNSNINLKPSTQNLHLSGTSSGPATTTNQGGHIRPVILKSTLSQSSGMSRGIKVGTGNGILLQNSFATNVRPTGINSAAPNLTGNVSVSAHSSNATQGSLNQSRGQSVGRSSMIPPFILPKLAIAGDVKHSSAFSIANQRPVDSVPQASNTSQIQIPRRPVHSNGISRLNKESTSDSAQMGTDRLRAQQLEMLQKKLSMVQKDIARIKGLVPPPQPPQPPQPPFPLVPLHLQPPVQPLPRPVPLPFQDPAGGLPNIATPGLDRAPTLAMPETAGAAVNDTAGMEAAAVELENMVETVMKMFPTADEGVVRGMLVENRNVNATCNHLLETLDATNEGIPVTAENNNKKEKEKEIDYFTVDHRTRGFIHNYHQYFNQGLDLLSNDFIKISKMSLRLLMQHLTRGSYAKTKKLLEDTIKANPNIKALLHDDTKGSFFHIEKEGRKFEIRLMKKARKPIHFFCNMHPELQKEIDFYKKYLISETEKADFEVALKLNEDQYEQEGQLIECGCCYLEVTFENMIQCLEGHLFCQTCLQRYTKEAVFGQGKATLSCLEDGCDSVFPRSQLEKVLTKEILVKYDERVVEESINMADVDNLLRCPNCNYPAVLDKDHKVFSCPECHKETCRNCKEPWKDHYGLECDQVKKQSTMRLTYQERMTEAKVRTCYKCGTKFTKSEGCNKMTCRCGAKMCYICRQPIKDYSHFDNRAAPPRGQIWAPKAGEKCRLWTNSDEDDDRAVKEIERQMKAEERAMREQSAADLKRPNAAGSDDGGGSDAKRPRTG